MTSTNITATLKKKAAGFFEASINLHPNMKRHIQEDIIVTLMETNLVYFVKLKWIRKKDLCPVSSFYPVGFLEIMIKSKKNISLDSRRPH
jgi:hypothetical protein